MIAAATYDLRILRRFGSFVVDPSSGGRLPGIQGVRAVSAAAILLLHIWYYTAPDGGVQLGRVSRLVYPHLPLGVTLLFVLSGFLLYRPFAASVMRAKRTPSLTRYLRNRALRILPAYWFILLFASLVLQTTQVRVDSGQTLAAGPLDPGLLALNATFLQSLIPSTLVTGIGPAWALTNVVVFYVLLPLLVLIASALAGAASSRRGRTLAALAPAGLLLAIGLSGKAVVVFVLPGDPWTATWPAVVERSFWSHADLFALGLAVAVLRVESEDGRLRLPSWWWKPVVAALLLIALPTARFTIPEAFADGSLSSAVYNVLMAVVCALFLALVVLPTHERPSPLVRLLESPGVVAFGVVSYSLFIWQVPLIVWMRSHGFTMDGSGGLAVNVVVLGSLTFLLSALTYRYLEFPALKRKSSTLPRSRVEQPVSPQQAEVAPASHSR